MDKITQILKNVVRCKYFEAGVHIKNPIKNSSQDGLGRTTQTLEHVVVVHILIWDKRKSEINEYRDLPTCGVGSVRVLECFDRSHSSQTEGQKFVLMEVVICVDRSIARYLSPCKDRILTCNVTGTIKEYSNYMCQCVSRERWELDNSQLKMNEKE